jgi:rSAM/selenodomain-associated transferase 2
VTSSCLRGSLRLSVVIPAWQEAPRIAAAVAAARGFADEVIVADSGSPDGTAGVALAAGARVVTAPRGRGPQLQAGARAATGDVLLFLHADATVEPEARQAIFEALRDPEVLGGNFRLAFVPATRWARFYSLANDVRRRWLRIYYGDSALFVRRRVFGPLGGFASMPLFEDYDFVRRLERRGRTAYLRRVEVKASARRFLGAPLRTLLVWTLLQVLYSAGVRPARLARLYRDLR